MMGPRLIRRQSYGPIGSYSRPRGHPTVITQKNERKLGKLWERKETKERKQPNVENQSHENAKKKNSKNLGT